jgi:hypothetical protein
MQQAGPYNPLRRFGKLGNHQGSNHPYLDPLGSTFERGPGHGVASGKPGNKITGVCVVLLPPLFFCAGTAGTAGTPHKQGLAAVPALFEQRGQRGQKQRYPQQEMCYPLILLNKQAIQHGHSNSGHRVKLDLNSSPLPSGRRFAAVGTGSPHRAGRGHQQPHQINTAQRRLIRAGAGPVPLPPPRTAAPAPASKQPARPWLAQGIGLGWWV